MAIKLHMYLTLFLLGSIPNLPGAPTSQSSGIVENRSTHNPERNPEFKGDDIVPPPFTNSLAERSTGSRPAHQRWSGGVVPYEIAGNISANNSIFIVNMMRAIENLTQVNNTQCISFRPKTVSDPYFITVFNGRGCYAPIGFWGAYVGVRPVSFLHGTYATCMVSGIIQHELMHVLGEIHAHKLKMNHFYLYRKTKGFYHEQSRPDRDLYVSIQWRNIDPTMAYNFDKYNDTYIDTLFTSYDYGSVMHYERNAFALNASGVTIIPIQNASAYIGQRIQLSPIDILTIQRYYGCVPTPSTLNTATNRMPVESESDLVQ
ncbi:unnamed protein product [Rotaria socialis]|uniref:Metalloendopeptidase n=3 Tax=Rotaria socialis TaxID=392032 RepID=A0A818L9W9_9BILA|nr:unnamed protein product [Rotaria socialis]